LNRPATTRRAILAAPLAAPAARAEAPPVRIGMLLPVTGRLAALAPPMRAGIALALAEVAAAGGVLGGRPLEAIEADDRSDPLAGVAAARMLVERGVAAIIGPAASGVVVAVANAVTVPAGVPLISPAATAPAVSWIRDDDTVFRTAVPEGLQGRVLARLAREAGLARVAALFANTEAGRGLLAAFASAFATRGGTVTASQAYEEARPSYRAELQALAARGEPQALLVVGAAGSGGATILRESAALRAFSRHLGMGGLRDEAAGPLEGMFGTGPASADSRGLQAFAEAFRRANPTLDPAAPFAAEAYDAAMLLALAVQAGGAEPGAIRRQLRAVANGPGEAVGPGDFARARDLLSRGMGVDYGGASGPLEFDEAGDARGIVEQWAVRGGRVERVGLLSA
jgi:branched-chain amino acid transport system substrate-binding protein